MLAGTVPNPHMLRLVFCLGNALAMVHIGAWASFHFRAAWETMETVIKTVRQTTPHNDNEHVAHKHLATEHADNEHVTQKHGAHNGVSVHTNYENCENCENRREN